MPVHVVRSGECLSVIAAHYGFQDYRALYDHPDNAELKKKRPNPNIIHPGDELVIPEHKDKKIECATGRVHEFVAKLPKKRLKLTFRDEAGEPLAHEPYVLRAGVEEIEDETNGSGEIDHPIPVSLRSATVEIAGRRYVLSIGDLNPVKDTDDDGLSGLRARLMNLGGDPRTGHDEMDDPTRHALAMFQLRHDLPVTGEPDEKTLDKLEEIHGC
jgi:N-acetylmuramoyl-L-alanine amidase